MLFGQDKILKLTQLIASIPFAEKENGTREKGGLDKSEEETSQECTNKAL